MKRTALSPRIAYQHEGSAGPQVLFIMGFGMRGQAWKPQFDELSKTHQVAWFDNRGIGESEPSPASFTVVDLAHDALAVAADLGWERFHLVGVSLGGMIAQELALEAGARVRSLTLIATHAGGPLGLLPTFKGLVPWVKAVLGPAEGRPQAQIELLYTPSLFKEISIDVLREQMRANVGPKPPLRTVLQQALAVLRHDTRNRLADLQVPTLVIKPESDLLIRPFHSDRLHRKIHGAELLSVADAGHGVTFQHAKRVNASIAEHVKKHETSRGR